MPLMVIVKFGEEIFPIEIEASAGVVEFLKKVEAETGLPPSRQSFFKGKKKIKYKKTMGKTFAKMNQVELRDKEGRMPVTHKATGVPRGFACDNQHELGGPPPSVQWNCALCQNLCNYMGCPRCQYMVCQDCFQTRKSEVHRLGEPKVVIPVPVEPKASEPEPEEVAPEPEEVESPTTPEMTEEDQLKLAMAMSMEEEKEQQKRAPDNVEVSSNTVDTSVDLSPKAVAAKLAAIGSATAAESPAAAVESPAPNKSPGQLWEPPTAASRDSITEAEISEKVQKVLEQVGAADMNLILSLLQENSYDTAAVINTLFETGMGMDGGLGLEDNDEPEKKEETAQGYAKAKKKAGVYHVKSRADYDRLLKSERLLCAKFSGQWCPPSRMVASKIKSIAAHYPGMKFVHCECPRGADTWSNRLMQAYGIRGVPTFVFFHEGKEVPGMRVGGADPDSVSNNTATLLSQFPEPKLEEEFVKAEQTEKFETQTAPVVKEEDFSNMFVEETPKTGTEGTTDKPKEEIPETVKKTEPVVVEEPVVEEPEPVVESQPEPVVEEPKPDPVPFS